MGRSTGMAISGRAVCGLVDHMELLYSCRMELARLGDLFAIPFFLWLCIYFYRKPVLTEEEKIFYIFAATGLVADLMFVFVL
jgi:hypothetical protein